jgi:hypothetical protein
VRITVLATAQSGQGTKQIADSQLGKARARGEEHSSKDQGATVRSEQ